jgi:flagellar hook-associated protein 3 FlgL
MRVSTNTIYDLGAASVQQQTSAMLKTQQQVASGRRILTPADDPVAAARVLEVSQAKAMNQQYDVNTNSATSALSLEEGVLQSVDNLILDVKEAIATAGGPLMSQATLSALATNLRARNQELLGLANSTDGNGQYMFSGYKGSTPPFSQNALGVAYSGDQGQRLMQISPSRQIAVSDSGSDVFMQIKNGNGTFVTEAGAANTGTGLISAGSATTAYDGNNYQVSFTSATAYDILDAASNVVGSGTYTSGSTITVGGGQFTISGAPAAGDSFTIQPSINVSLFKTINDLADALDNATGSGAALTNSLTTASSNMENALQRVLTVHASVGLRMREVESIKSAGQDTALQYEQTLSSLQDLDYTRAITDLEMQQVGLEAAQKSFLKMQGLSLFNYI